MEDDEFAGQGGSYERDVLTGKRTLIHRTEEAPLPAAPAEPVTLPAPAVPHTDTDNT